MLRNSLWLALLLSFQVHATEEPIFYNGFEPAEAGPPICPPIPDGWVTKHKTWQAAFSSPSGHLQANYPNGVGTPSPLPGYEFYPSTKFLKGQIIAIEFIPLPDKTVDMTFDTAQSQFGYTQPRPADGMFISISTCRWDVTPPEDPRCGVFASGASLFYTTRRPELGACPVDPGVPYYINVMMANPYDGLEVGEHSCSETAVNSANGCDVQIRSTGY